MVSGKSRAEPFLSVFLGGGGARVWFLVASDGRKRRGANRIEVEAATNNLEDEDEEKGPKESERAARRPATRPWTLSGRRGNFVPPGPQMPSAHASSITAMAIYQCGREGPSSWTGESAKLSQARQNRISLSLLTKKKTSRETKFFFVYRGGATLAVNPLSFGR